MTMLRWIRVRAKTLLARIATVIEFCKDCGVRQPLVWHADDWLWEQVSGDKGVLCPQCFTARARSLGLFIRWRPEVEFVRGADGEWGAP